MDTSAVNFYQVLGVTRTATAEDVRKAYKQKVLETHPDKLPPEVSERARQRMKDKFGLVHEAFQVLGDPDTRRAYDIHNRNLPRPGSSTPMPKWTTPSEDQQRRIREREAWARQAQERSQERIRLARQPKQSQSKPAQPAPSPAPSPAPAPSPSPSPAQLQVQVQTKEAVVTQTKVAETKQAEEYTAMVEAMLQELYRLSPEWEERKRRLEMRKTSPPRRLHTTS